MWMNGSNGSYGKQKECRYEIVVSLLRSRIPPRRAGHDRPGQSYPSWWFFPTSPDDSEEAELFQQLIAGLAKGRSDLARPGGQ